MAEKKQATSSDGKTYDIGSEKGLDFTNNAPAGATMTGGDGSTWTKNSDGSTTISKNGTTYRVGGSSGSTSGGGGGSSSGAGGTNHNTSPTVTNASNALSGAAASVAGGGGGGYKALGAYNDQALQGNGLYDPIAQYKAQYEAAKARGDQKGMDDAHAAAEAYRAQFGYSGGRDGSQNLAAGQISPELAAAAQQALAGVYGGGGGGGMLGTPMVENGVSMAFAADGSSYQIGSFLGKNFLLNGETGEVITGSDGSKWTKDASGMVTIETKDGKTYTVQGTPNEPIAEFEMPEFEMPEAFEVTPFNYTPFLETGMGQAARREYEEMLDKLNNYRTFEYDPATDPAYQQYADSYTRGGQRAMKDVMGQLAARTGGMASSWAGTMAQQQYDEYMAELANKVPQLRQLAYSMWSDEYNRNLDLYDRAYQRYAGDYDRYMQQIGMDQNTWATTNQLGQNTWATMANLDAQQQQFAAQMNYNQYRDKVEDRRWDIENNQNAIRENLANDYNAKQWNYNLQTAAAERARQAEQTQYDRSVDERNFALMEQQNRDAQRADLMDRAEKGYIPTAEDAARVGLTGTELASLQNYAREKNRQQSDRYYLSGGYY